MGLQAGRSSSGWHFNSTEPEGGCCARVTQPFEYGWTGRKTAVSQKKRLSCVGLQDRRFFVFVCSEDGIPCRDRRKRMMYGRYPIREILFESHLGEHEREDCCGNNNGTNMVKGRLLQRLGAAMGGGEPPGLNPQSPF